MDSICPRLDINYAETPTQSRSPPTVLIRDLKAEREELCKDEIILSVTPASESDDIPIGNECGLLLEEDKIVDSFNGRNKIFNLFKYNHKMDQKKCQQSL